MSTEEKIALLEELMDLDEGCLMLDACLDDYDEWDSLSKLSLIAAAKQKFGLVLKAETIRDFKTVKDICDYLK